MKKIIFRALNRWGSSLNRGEEISEHIKSKGHDSVYYDASNLENNRLADGIRDSIIIMLKFPIIPECEILEKNNNIS